MAGQGPGLGRTGLGGHPPMLLLGGHDGTEQREGPGEQAQQSGSRTCTASTVENTSVWWDGSWVVPKRGRKRPDPTPSPCHHSST